MKQGSIIILILIVMTTFSTILLTLFKTSMYGNILSIEREIHQKPK